jgi:hypothetical protein
MDPLPLDRPSRRPDVGEAALELTHSVMDGNWSSEEAGRRVWARARGDRHVLLVLRARVARHLAGRHSPIDERAAATLDAALRAADCSVLDGAAPDGSAQVIPQQKTG